MAGERNPSTFGKGGNKNFIHRSAPSIAPDTRNFVDYGTERKNGQLPSPSVFKNEGQQANIEPTILALDLTNAVTDQELPFSGNFIWFQSSTNATDAITFKYERVAATGLPLLPGNMIDGVGYTRLFISHAGIPGATAFIMLLTTSVDTPVVVL